MVFPSLSLQLWSVLRKWIWMHIHVHIMGYGHKKTSCHWDLLIKFAMAFSELGRYVWVASKY